ncbi:MAG TPA: radical SAM protein, partial [Thermoanaerobaculia bacterium]
MDRLLPEAGLRLRHLPGEVCLSCRGAWAPEAWPSPSLAAALSRCLQGDPSVLTIVKARSAAPRADLSGGPCPACGQPLEEALLDVGLGESAGLVAEALSGQWCWACQTGVLDRCAPELLGRLERFDPSEVGPAAPSLLYDTPEHPRSVQMEITTRCNLTCAYCSHRELEDKRDLPLDRFLELLNRVDLTRVDNVDFTGLGEPVMHRDLPAMVREVLRRGSPTHVRVVTNGTVMIPKRYEPLCEAGITSIAFSIDSLDPEKFARSRGGARLDQVLENLESLVAYRDRHGLTGLRIKIKAVLIDDAWEEAERLLAYSARLGIEMPHFSCLDARQNAETLYEQSWLESDWAREGGSDLMRWAAERWRELGGAPVESRPDAPTLADREAGFVHPVLEPSADLCRWAV